MDYAEAEKILSDWDYRFLYENDPVIEAIAKGLQAIRDCLQMGLNGKDEREDIDDSI